MNDRLNRWHEIQRGIAHCNECCLMWPNDVAQPLGALEIPPPPESVKVLFVGVAPTRKGGKNKGTHFYTSSSDSLRTNLFRLLAEPPFSLPLAGLNWRDAILQFHNSQCFFVHAAKIRPILEDAPPQPVIPFCARRHLLTEIQFIRPKAVCILSKTQVGPVTHEIFGTALTIEPRQVMIGTWTGVAAVARQPVRGGAASTRAVLSKLW
jgi:uracil-DNA glycosylase